MSERVACSFFESKEGLRRQRRTSRVSLSVPGKAPQAQVTIWRRKSRERFCVACGVWLRKRSRAGVNPKISCIGSENFAFRDEIFEGG